MSVIRLRGHHLLCLLGYRGMGYSEEYVENMTRVYVTLNRDGSTVVELVEGPDDLCAKFPCSGDYHCQNESVDARDKAVFRKLGLHVGDTLPGQGVLDRIRAFTQPGDIATLCESCGWRSYGVCEEGVGLVIQGLPLPDLERKASK